MTPCISRALSSALFSRLTLGTPLNASPLRIKAAVTAARPVQFCLPQQHQSSSAMDPQQKDPQQQAEHEYDTQPSKPEHHGLEGHVTRGFRVGMGQAYGDEYATRSEDEGFGQIYGDPVAGLELLDHKGLHGEDHQMGDQKISKRGNTTVEAVPHDT